MALPMTGTTYDKVALKLFYNLVFSCEAEYNYVYINMFHENKTQKLQIVCCLFQFNWDDTIRSQIA